MIRAWLKAAAIAQRRVTLAAHIWPCQPVSGQTLETRHMQCAGQVSKLAVRTQNPHCWGGNACPASACQMLTADIAARLPSGRHGNGIDNATICLASCGLESACSWYKLDMWMQLTVRSRAPWTFRGMVPWAFWAAMSLRSLCLFRMSTQTF